MTSDTDDKLRWRFTEFGKAFDRKYDVLRARAKPDPRFAAKSAIWWQEQSISAALGLAPSQWSNLRSAKPNKNALVHSWQLIKLAEAFELHDLVGNNAWQLFTPAVDYREFVRVLDGVELGNYKPRLVSAAGGVGFDIPAPCRFALRCPATIEQYDETARLTRELFGEDLIDLEADREAFLRNPYSMVVLVEVATDQVLGWTDIYYLPDEDISLMIEHGEVRILPSRGLSFPESCAVPRAYTASIAIHRHRRGLTRLLIYGMMEFLLQFQYDGLNEFELFAVGLTDRGTGLLRWLEFKHQRTVQMVSGEFGLYSKRCTQTELRRHQHNIWQRLGLCRTDVEVAIHNPLRMHTGNGAQTPR